VGSSFDRWKNAICSHCLPQAGHWTCISPFTVFFRDGRIDIRVNDILSFDGDCVEVQNMGAASALAEKGGDAIAQNQGFLSKLLAGLVVAGAVIHTGNQKQLFTLSSITRIGS
jgi:hypothetical protein